MLRHFFQGRLPPPKFSPYSMCLRATSKSNISKQTVPNQLGILKPAALLHPTRTQWIPS
eukprot:c33176_g1_i1 orf=2-175(-)